MLHRNLLLLKTIVTKHIPVQKRTSPRPCPAKWSSHGSVAPNSMWIYCSVWEQMVSATALVRSQPWNYLTTAQTLQLTIGYCSEEAFCKSKLQWLQFCFPGDTFGCSVWVGPSENNSSWLMFTQNIDWCRQRRDLMIRYAYISAVFYWSKLILTQLMELSCAVFRCWIITLLWQQLNGYIWSYKKTQVSIVFVFLNTLNIYYISVTSTWHCLSKKDNKHFFVTI